MPLIVNNIISPKPETPVENPKPEPTVRRAPQEIVAAPKPAEKVVKSEPRLYADMGDQYIVVNGKPKKISKHSQYLVDMLTTEE